MMAKTISVLFALVLALGAATASNPSVNRVSQAVEDFNTRLLSKLIDEQAGNEPTNIFISPISLNMVLSMLMAGSNGNTYSQIHKTLGFHDESNKDIFTAYRQIFSEMKSKLAPTKTTLDIANSIAVQKNAQLLQAFMNNITVYFESEVLMEDFRQHSHAATDELNLWVSDKTHQKIKKLFDQDLDPSTIMVLMNAIYFKGNWKTQFEKKKTFKSKFLPKPGQYQEMDAMSMKSYFNFAEFADGKLLEMPYENETLSMYIFLPNDGKDVSMSHYLNAVSLDERISELKNTSVVVQFPKFHIEASYTLNRALVEMGITEVFTNNADLSNINGAHDLSVSAVLQKTYIEVNEEGAEAAAATGVIITINSVNLHQKTFVANRPFVFFIRDNQHRLTLFSGVIYNPGKAQ